MQVKGPEKKVGSELHLSVQEFCPGVSSGPTSREGSRKRQRETLGSDVYTTKPSAKPTGN